ncbi:sugar-binding transcriptional regulator [Salirhabdus salicampi]|uniref:sugar-binding transcriptional regulator n=1 Tax=Salirhabdus salicampi TaxID=476102 RepID=UPI0020C1F6ED|nr:sugar-binding domain-containing protein [Salirhabdus salicampi]MCP8617649.1 hypothetical protein [Salirhabdus salicampi]
MQEIIRLQQKIAPDVLTVLERRYQLLKIISLLQPIGRRSLAEQTDNPERLIRSDVEFFQEQGFVDVNAKGMTITPEGTHLVEQLSSVMNQLSGLDDLEEQLRKKFNLQQVIVVPGNSDDVSRVKQELGKACVKFLQQILGEHMTIAVTGGSTMSAVAKSMKPLNYENCLFVPSRGGLGEQVENQANTICVEMAQKAKGTYRLLYVPDPISEESYHTLIEEPAVKEILETIRQADVVIHGIGDAMTMAERRKTPAQQLEKLKDAHAVGEAFGYYFDKSGEIIHKVRTVGLQVENLETIPHVIAVAGGASKADAIASYFKLAHCTVLITDEAAATMLVKGNSLSI